MRGMDGMEEGINLGMIGTRRNVLNLHGIQMLVYASMAVWSVIIIVYSVTAFVLFLV